MRDERGVRREVQTGPWNLGSVLLVLSLTARLSPLHLTTLRRIGSFGSFLTPSHHLHSVHPVGDGPLRGEDGR